ncbi:MAG: biopolymer transporter ExbD [Cellvibrionaceae bacterium]|nr:biopolymer transporter ExbD [Cellvibrionaceae bacterium]
MRFKYRHKTSDSELDITSFLNLMIILVPVLLVMMVFSRITVIDLNLPDLAAADPQSDLIKQLEVVLRDDQILVNYPAGTLVKRVPQKDGEHDFRYLSRVLQEIKRRLKDQGIDKRDALILSEPNTDYQSIVSAYDTVRSFKAVVVTDVVDAELFPVISLGDAPVVKGVAVGQSVNQRLGGRQ